MKIGYIIASNQIMKDGKKIGYLYREKPEDENDSGWRVFSGDESQEYVDNSANFAMYNAVTIVELEPQLKNILDSDYPVTFERDQSEGHFIEVEDQS